jgi:hypothetical protein
MGAEPSGRQDYNEVDAGCAGLRGANRISVGHAELVKTTHLLTDAIFQTGITPPGISRRNGQVRGLVRAQGASKNQRRGRRGERR